MREEWKYWIALSMVYGVGDVRIKNLYSRFRSARDVFYASENELRKVDGIGDKKVSEIKKFNDWARVDNELGKIEKSGLSFITLNDPKYPESLQHIYNPPPFIYERGSLEHGDKVSIAIVGTRMPDRYGRKVTETLAGEIQRHYRFALVKRTGSG